MVSVVEPPDRSVLFIAPELPRSQMLLRAVVPPDASTVRFRLNGQVLGSVSAERPEMITNLAPGDYQLEVEAATPAGPVFAHSTFRVVQP